MTTTRVYIGGAAIISALGSGLAARALFVVGDIKAFEEFSWNAPR